MDPLDQIIRSLAFSGAYYAIVLFFWWAFGFEFAVVMLLATLVYKSF